MRGSENEGSQFFSSPIRIDDDTVLIADNNKRLLRVDSVVVEVQRSYPLADKVLTNMLLVDDMLFLPYQNGGLTAVALEDFQERWTLNTESGVWAQPLPVDDMLIIPSIDHYLYAVDRETGARLWALDLGGAVASTPLLANGRLYVGSFDKSFFEISLDGVILNEYVTQNWVWGTPAADERGIIYVRRFERLRTRPGQRKRLARTLVGADRRAWHSRRPAGSRRARHRGVARWQSLLAGPA